VIPESAKVYASSLFPAKCPSCGQLVGVRSFMAGSLVFSIETLLILPLAITGAISPVSAGVGLWAVFAGCSLVFGSLGKLQKITNNEVLATRVPMSIFAVFVVIGTLFNV